MKQNKLRVAITHGDINGVGYEVIIKALSDQRMTELCTPVVYGAAKVSGYYKKVLDVPNLQFNIVVSADNILPDRVNFVNCFDDELKVEIGKPSLVAGEASLKALEVAVKDLKEGKVDVLVTAPINKNTIQSENFKFTGHTEYLQNRLGEDSEPLMILMNENLKVALVTTHEPIKELSEKITKELIIKKLNIFNTSLKKDFRLERPRIAVLSLNPHAGDGGLIGDEEKETIIPAIEEAYNSGLVCFGPYPADGFFGAGLYKNFDGVLAMYHDQGLAPFKALSMDDGVNYTAGLDYVRTSPDHGTAYDIAGKSKASANSMRQAIYAAIDVYNNREMYAEITANPLRKQYVDKSGKDESVNLMQDAE
ncbi:MAG: 4-hydroxythreonine-4-phosphate dehydrogenase PdxA [Bacteroidales bacterium]|nr:4-hydroxythreonine-4-phosphate dehydrogenase PdxA [Bacteroidales bacterium]MBR5532696.1 4-hydroxythreonine-4-phosphate dehydrogenase PdxA [Bacteroidales bacterium]